LREGFCSALHLGWLCQPVTLRSAQSVFCGIHAAAKNGFQLFRAAAAARTL
jgi:hypothetical protein